MMPWLRMMMQMNSLSLLEAAAPPPGGSGNIISAIASSSAFLLLVPLLLYLVWYHSAELQWLIQIIPHGLQCVKNKRCFPHVTSATIEPWKEPPETLPIANDTTTASAAGNGAGGGAVKKNPKVIWGYWHQGEDAMPGFCKAAVTSWRVQNPDWTVIILCDETCRQYVSRSDIPSTFYSLRVQHRSDLVRLAVLRRYGGLYLDASYLVARAFDDIWEKAEREGSLYLTNLLNLYDNPRHPLDFPNNCLLLCPRPQHPTIVAWHEGLIRYLEDPCKNYKEMKVHPIFRNVRDYFDDSAFGVLGGPTHAYFANLWILVDILYFRAAAADHPVYLLPRFRWNLDIFMIELATIPDDQIDTYVSPINMSMRHWLGQRLPLAIPFMFRNKHILYEKCIKNAYAFKCSSDMKPDMTKPFEHHISQRNTLGRICRYCVDPTKTIHQATLKGSRLVLPTIAVGQGQ